MVHFGIFWPSCFPHTGAWPHVLGGKTMAMIQVPLLSSFGQIFFWNGPQLFKKIVETAGILVSSPQKKLPSWIIMVWSIWLKTKKVWTRSTLQRRYQKGPSYPSLAIAGVAGVGRRVSFLDEWILGPLLAILGIKCSLTSLDLDLCGGNSNISFNFHPGNWGNDLILLIFFRWVGSTTN